MLLLALLPVREMLMSIFALWLLSCPEFEAWPREGEEGCGDASRVTKPRMMWRKMDVLKITWHILLNVTKLYSLWTFSGILSGVRFRLVRKWFMQPETNSEHRQIYLIDVLNCYFSSQSCEQLGKKGRKLIYSLSSTYPELLFNEREFLRYLLSYALWKKVH